MFFYQVYSSAIKFNPLTNRDGFPEYKDEAEVGLQLNFSRSGVGNSILQSFHPPVDLPVLKVEDVKAVYCFA